MTTLVVGATGATGRLLMQQLLGRGQEVRAIVRSRDKLPVLIRSHKNLKIIEGSPLDFDDTVMAEHVRGCSAVVSCLGHNLSFKGIYGSPRRLVTQATERLCGAIKANRPGTPTKFILMNTTGNRNRDLDEPVSLGERAVVGLLRLLLPPQADNEKAADYLREQIGRNGRVIEWVAVRPDTLVDANEITEYVVHPSPIRSVLFDAGRTSRINVAHFMAELVTNDQTWIKWKGQMPVIYNV